MIDDKNLVFQKILGTCSKESARREILRQIDPDTEVADLWLDLLVKYSFVGIKRGMKEVYEITSRGREIRELLESFEEADSHHSLSPSLRYGNRPRI